MPMKKSFTPSSTPDLTTLFQQLEKSACVIDKKDQVIAQLNKRIDFLEERLRLEQHKQFAPSSEKSTQQGDLFNEAEVLVDETPEPNEPPKKTKKSGGRKGLSPSLPRHQVHLRLSDEEKDGAMDTFFTLVKEELDIVPAQARVIEYLQEKAVFLDDHGNREFKAADKPRHPLGKCIASVVLLAHVVIAKFADGLPLYRQETLLKRYGGDITRTSMANWVIKLAEQLQPLMNLLREHQFNYDYLNIDETRIKVLKPDKPTDTEPPSYSWMWVSVGGPPSKPAILFEYDPSRGKEVPLRLLDGFTGFLQCDGLESYDAACKAGSIVRLGCMDHARRKFKEAQNGQKRSKNAKQKVSKADVGLGKINALYRLERSIKDNSPEDKYQLRQKVAIPLLDELKRWLEDNATRVPKDSLTSKAIHYTLNQWDRLTQYTQDGRLNISNIMAENAIRPFVIGRKNWLFSDTAKGAKASAVHYSLIETCKANGVEPQQYYQYILSKLPYAESVADIESLLPWNVKPVFEKNSELGR